MARYTPRISRGAGGGGPTPPGTGGVGYQFVFNPNAAQNPAINLYSSWIDLINAINPPNLPLTAPPSITFELVPGVPFIVPAGTWKRLLKVPGKKNSAPGDLVLRAVEMFPNHRAVWRGVKGGLKVDRAEASMLAWYGVEYALRAPYVKNIDEWTHRYRHEDETAP